MVMFTKYIINHPIWRQKPETPNQLNGKKPNDCTGVWMQGNRRGDDEVANTHENE